VKALRAGRTQTDGERSILRRRVGRLYHSAQQMQQTSPQKALCPDWRTIESLNSRRKANRGYASW